MSLLLPLPPCSFVLVLLPRYSGCQTILLLPPYSSPSALCIPKSCPHTFFSPSLSSGRLLALSPRTFLLDSQIAIELASSERLPTHLRPWPSTGTKLPLQTLVLVAQMSCTMGLTFPLSCSGKLGVSFPKPYFQSWLLFRTDTKVLDFDVSRPPDLSPPPPPTASLHPFCTAISGFSCQRESLNIWIH